MDVIMGLSDLQASVVANFFSLVLAVFIGSALFFFLSRFDVAEKYRSAVTISGVIVTIAGYHYWRIGKSFDAALAGEAVFNEAYRYVDWVVTVPLLLAELVLVLSLSADRRRSLMNRLVPASFLMIALGYPGEISTDPTQKWIWWALSMVFFVYILTVLFGELSKQIASEREEVRSTLTALRTVLLVTWLFYPIAYLFPILLGATGTAFVAVNVGYAIADITAKAGYGLLVHHVAKVKTEIGA